MAYATLDELRDRLHIPPNDATKDEWLQVLLDAATTAVEQLAGGRRFAVDEEETRLIDFSPETVMGRILRLPDDMHSISQVVNGDGVVVSADEFVTLPRLASVVGGVVIAPTSTILTSRPFYEIHLKVRSGKVWTYVDDYEGAISVTGSWGYSATPPGPIHVATLDLAMHLYKIPETIERPIVSPDGELLTPGAIPDHIVGYVMQFARVM